MGSTGLVLLHLTDQVRRAVDPAEVFLLEAVGDETDVRLRGAKPLRDVRSIGEVLPAFEAAGLVRIHRSYAVNPQRVHEIRPRRRGSGWEVKLEPPVNRVLDVSRREAADLFSAFSE